MRTTDLVNMRIQDECRGAPLGLGRADSQRQARGGLAKPALRPRLIGAVEVKLSSSIFLPGSVASVTRFSPRSAQHRRMRGADR
jgi:hypothetical protein